MPRDGRTRLPVTVREPPRHPAVASLPASTVAASCRATSQSPPPPDPAVAAGALTPLSASAAVGTMAVAYRTVHQPNGYFVVSEGWEYVDFIAATAVALSALGSGRVSVDRVLGWESVGRPSARAATTLGLGVVGALVQLRAYWSPTKP